MRTLLLDNYDSYTYNLFQLIARVQNAEPTVVRNDEVDADDLDLEVFDNVVISPGPGDPRNRRDFGLAAHILSVATIPVLGVCLGHQGIAVAERADFGPAPVARHGHLARIRHDGRGLFRSIPQSFTAVRYHSLSVREPLPPALRATAWADDGVLMGVRHHSRPFWGVQFHPESVLTEHGDKLLANFRDLTRRHARRGRSLLTGWTAPAAAAVDPAAGQAAAVDPAAGEAAAVGPVAGEAAAVDSAAPAETPAAAVDPTPSAPGYRLHKRLVRGAVDAETAFRRRFAGGRHAFWLDSSRVVSGQSRFSYLGDGTGPLAEFVRCDVTTGIIQVERPGRPSRLLTGSVFEYLQTELARRRADDPTVPFDFTCGYVGYFGYEMKADCGSGNRHQAATSDACWLFADRVVVVDHQERVTYLMCLAEDTPAGRAGAAEWLDRTATFLRTARSAEPPPAVAAGTGDDEATRELVEASLVRDRRRYLADIAACKRELAAGESYEICVTNAAWLPADGEPLDYYRILRRLNPAPYAAFLRFGDVAVACSSPERFLTIDRGGTAESKPIKGTAPRGSTPALDEALRSALAADPKTRAENLMIVDLLRNDLGQVCQVGSVHVPSLMHTETYATVHQLVSTVRGRLRDGVDAVDCVRACFPGGSMTGAPKLRTMEIIEGLETEARGVYSGAIGFLSCNGTADLNIAIRTAVFVGGRMHLGAGGAIVLGSDPVAEYDEMLLKTAVLTRAYRQWTSADGTDRRQIAQARR